MATLRNRSRKHIKYVNLMVAGHSRTGKSDFLQTLFETLDTIQLHPIHNDEILFPADVRIPTEASSRIECYDTFGDEKLMLSLIDCPGLEIPSGIHKAPNEDIPLIKEKANQYLKCMLRYIDKQYYSTLVEESLVKRTKNRADTDVHACLYFLNPDLILASKGLTMMDQIVLPTLCQRVNLIPCLAKSDLITVRDLKQIQEYLHQDSLFKELPIFDFVEDDEEQSDSEALDLKSMLPFCLVNSEELFKDENGERSMGIMINGNKVLGREYIWGTIEVENQEHCDFSVLKNAILGSHLDVLLTRTKEVLYEHWRTAKLVDGQGKMTIPSEIQKIVANLDATEE